MEPTPIILIKETCNGKSDKYVLKLKLRWYPRSSTSDLYECNMSLFDHVEQEEFLLFIWNFNMTLSEKVTLEMDANIKYLHTLVCGEALRQFDLLSYDVENTETVN